MSLKPNTSVAYAGTMKVHFEIHAVDQCNMWCQECCHFSPYFTALHGAKEYTGDQYVPWIDKMLEIGIEIPIITVLGGEPFLHSDLGSFIRTLKQRYPKITTRIVSNGFWLRDESKWGQWSELFQFLDILDLSEYPTMKLRVGDYHGQMHKIGKMFPKCHVTHRDIDLHTRFTLTSNPLVVTHCCHYWRHIMVTVDGRMWRCPTAAYAMNFPGVTKEFLAARDRSAVYYLNGVNDVGLFDWLNRYPLEACSFCTLWREENMYHTINPERYLAIVKGRK